ncbi:hypothetical protein MRX96_057200 [Rhipicephalus microplus]
MPHNFAPQPGPIVLDSLQDEKADKTERYDEELPPDVERNSGDLIRLIEQLPPDVEDDYGNLIRLMKVLPLDVEHDYGDLIRRPEAMWCATMKTLCDTSSSWRPTWSSTIVS